MYGANVGTGVDTLVGASVGAGVGATVGDAVGSTKRNGIEKVLTCIAVFEATLTLVSTDFNQQLPLLLTYATPRQLAVCSHLILHAANEPRVRVSNV